MNYIILDVLCEGQTEGSFVNKVLKPYLKPYNIIVKNRIVITSNKKGGVGGLLSYNQAKGDLLKWHKEVSRRNSETHYFTTMFDLYALPNDFPGYEKAKPLAPYNKVETLENAFRDNLQDVILNFIPYIQLHEFEALLFCDISRLEKTYPESKKEIGKLGSVLAKYGGNPELINNNPNTAPSKRIIKALEGKYHYNKPKSGAEITSSISMNSLLSKCQHFSQWVQQLKSIGEK